LALRLAALHRRGSPLRFVSRQSETCSDRAQLVEIKEDSAIEVAGHGLEEAPAHEHAQA
jgi:hypothetical protein